MMYKKRMSLVSFLDLHPRFVIATHHRLRKREREKMMRRTFSLLSGGSQTTKYVAMTEDYSARTRGAKDVIDATWPLAEKAINSLTIGAGSDSPLYFGDYGTADGGTSLDFVTKLVTKARENQGDRYIHINYSDLPMNDFNALFRNVNGATRAQGDGTVGLTNIFSNLSFSGAPISFYQLVCPPNTLHFGFSATAMHWHRSTPAQLQDHVHMAASSDSRGVAQFRAAAHEDLVQNLSMRAQEMCSGGYFLLINFGITKNTHFYLGKHSDISVSMFDQFNKILGEMVAEGRITPVEMLNTNFPQTYRQEEDYEAAISDARLKDQLEIVDLKEQVTPCPYHTKLTADGNKEWFLTNYPWTIRTWSQPVFLAGLDASKRSPEERNELVNEFYDRYFETIKANPEDHAMPYAHHVVLLRKK